MVLFKTGNLFDEDVEALVNTVNCVGVMGRGVALQFKNIFPDNFRAYRAACARAEVQPGTMFVYENPSLSGPRLIINFPTKRHWRSKSRMADVESGLTALAEAIQDRGIRSIAIPPLASGLGGLNWADIRPRIETALGGLDDVAVIVFEPTGATTDGRPNRSQEAPKMSAGNAVLIELIHRYLSGLLEPTITLLEIHKLMYFMQEAGQPLRLQFVQATHGPYAMNLRHVMQRLEGHFLSGYKDGGDAPDKAIGLIPGASQDAKAFMEAEPETRTRFERVSDLVDGFETPFGLELLSTVQWVAKDQQVDSDRQVIDHVYAWGTHKRKFSERHIYLALETLRSSGWIQPSPKRKSSDPIAQEDFSGLGGNRVEQPQLFDF